MDFLKKLAKLFSSGGQPTDPGYWITVKCRRCGEEIPVRINLFNDLSIEYSEDGKTAQYFCRKGILGSNGLCFQMIELELRFDSQRRLIDHEITGGELIRK
jgi:hypothetical protein